MGVGGCGGLGVNGCWWVWGVGDEWVLVGVVGWGEWVLVGFGGLEVRGYWWL